MGVLNPSKQELRKKLLEVRDGLEHRREREEAIAENLLSLPQYRRAASLLLYIGRASEVGTALILRRALEQGKEVCVPYCPPGDGAMFFCRIDSTEELKPGRYFGAGSEEKSGSYGLADCSLFGAGHSF